jgi:tRNA pseudouridine55 synthase
VPERTVEIYQIQVLDWRPGEFAEIDVAIACGSGTYIRAIARDLGASLNIGGVLASLTRTQSCGFDLAASLTLEELEAQLHETTFQPVPPVEALKHLTAVTLLAEDAHRWRLGQRLSWNDTPTNTPTNALRVHHEDGDFLGIGQVMRSESGLLLAPQMVFASATEV